jgi:hypothetical protein
MPRGHGSTKEEVCKYPESESQLQNTLIIFILQGLKEHYDQFELITPETYNRGGQIYLYGSTVLLLVLGRFFNFFILYTLADRGFRVVSAKNCHGC